MASGQATLRYGRPAASLWRDTGAHVVVLPVGEETEVKVLGGGGALVWRLLEQPQTVEELFRSFAAAGVPAPHDEVRACLSDLHEQGLIETDEPAPTRWFESQLDVTSEAS